MQRLGDCGWVGESLPDEDEPPLDQVGVEVDGELGIGQSRRPGVPTRSRPGEQEVVPGRCRVRGGPGARPLLRCLPDIRRCPYGGHRARADEQQPDDDPPELTEWQRHPGSTGGFSVDTPFRAPVA